MYKILLVNSLLQLPLHLYPPGGNSVFPSVSFYACNRGGKEKIVMGCVGKAKHVVTNLHSKIVLQILESWAGMLSLETR